MIILPSQETKTWRQLNKGHYFGELFATFNIDLLSDRGKIKISPRTYKHFDNSDDADFGNVAAILRSAADTTDRWWAIAGTKLFKSATIVPDSAWAQDAIANSPTTNYLQSDMKNWENKMVVSTSTDLALMTAGTWDNSYWITTLGKSALSLNEHPLGVYNRILLVGDGNLLHSIDRNGLATASRVTLPPEFEIIKIMPSIDKVWLLTKHIYGGDAQIFSWDGFSDTYNFQYPIKAPMCLSGVLLDNIPYVTTSIGQILRYNGGGFVEAASFPIFDENIYDDITSRVGATWGDYLGVGAGSNPVNANGMEIIDDKVHILINGKITGDDNNLLENMFSGIWCLDESIGLHHRFSLSQYKASGTIIDKGIGIISHAGPLISTDKNNGLFLAGASFYPSNSSTETSSLFINDTNDTLDKSGYIIVSRIQPSVIQSLFNIIWLQFSKMRSATDKILIKKRQSKDYNLGFRASVTFTNTTTFTSTDANFANANSGDEIEFVRGYGAGITAHISTISVNAGTYTIVLDETISNIVNGNTARCYVRDWVKIDTYTDSSSSGELFKKYPIGGVNPWTDFKIELRGYKDSPTLEQISIISKENTNPNQ